MAPGEENSSNQYAPYVCTNCKSRKKACDKKLPTCNACIQRRLECRYVAPATLRNGEECNISAKRTAAYQDVHLAPTSVKIFDPSTAFSKVNFHSISSSSLLLDIFSDRFPSNQPPLDRLSASTSVDEIIHQQVFRIIQTTGQFIDDVSVQYFQGFHRWMPIISRRRFHNHLVSSSGPPAADLSILLLSMCLITYVPSQIQAQTADQETLYLNTKMLFAHVQALIPSSTPLIQAGALIATFEYSHGRPDAAFVSIGLCARMAYVIGLHKITTPSMPFDDDAALRAAEQKNLWWGIVLKERIICSADPSLYQLVVTEVPSIENHPPVEPDHLDQSDGTHAATTLGIPVQFVGGFGCGAQATCLLGRVLYATTTIDIQAKQTEFKSLDVQLQSFLRGIIGHGGGNSPWGLYCASIAITIRALFVLHLHILSQVEFTELDKEWQQSSSAALDTVTKIVIDIAYSYEEKLVRNNIDVLPPIIWYVNRAAKKHLDLTRHVESKTRSRDYEALDNVLRHFSRRWGCVDI